MITEKDMTLEQEMQNLQLTMVQKEQQMKDIYRREDKLQR